MRLELHSERFAATGNLASDGARNHLGRPRLDPLTVLIREVVQNSWDARQGRSIRFLLDLSQTGAERAAALRDGLEGLPQGLDFTASSDPDSWTLCLSDRGTIGLGGPTRADRPPVPGERQDFVGFLRNLGQTPDKSLGGGTYGFGKAALYAVSRVRSIFVYSRTMHAGSLQHRLIGACLGPGFTVQTGAGAGRYTGRHWWGRISDGIAEPLLDDEAVGAAAELGFPPFAEGECGTSILIPDFISGADNERARSPEEAFRFLRSAFLWNFWPKLVPLQDGTLPIRVETRFRGEVVPLPPLHACAPLNSFARALEIIRMRRENRPVPPNSRIFEIRSERPKKHLGWLAFHRDRYSQQRNRDMVWGPEVGGLSEQQCSHVALMRTAELVVGYQPGPPLELDLLEYAGVFVVSDEQDVDQAYAASEPPTHDAWEPGSLQDVRVRRLVSVGMTRVRECTQEFARPLHSAREPGTRTPLGRLSSMLGRVLTGMSGPGGEVGAVTHAEGPVISGDPAEPASAVKTSSGPSADSGQGGIGSGEQSAAPEKLRPRSPRLRISEPKLAVEDGRGVLQIRVDLRHGQGQSRSCLEVSSEVLIDGGETEKAPPQGAALPEVWPLWMWQDDKPVRLEEALPWWDPATDLLLSRRVKLDVGNLRADCALPDGAVIRLVAAWHCRGTGLRGGCDPIVLPERGSAEYVLELQLEASRLAGEMSLRTAVVLVSNPEPGPLSAVMPGTVLWEDRLELRLEGGGSRFPIDVFSFPDSGADFPDGAAWRLDWDPENLELPVLGGMQLMLNSAHPSVAKALAQPDEPLSRMFLSLLHFEVAAALLRGALSQEQFVSDHAWPSDSIGRSMQLLLKTRMPEWQPSALRQLLLTEPDQFNAVLQDRLGFLRDV